MKFGILWHDKMMRCKLTVWAFHTIISYDLYNGIGWSYLHNNIMLTINVNFDDQKSENTVHG